MAASKIIINANVEFFNNVNCCEILKYLQVYEPDRSIILQERG